MYRIMYRTLEMKYARSVVVINEEGTKLVEARFNSEEVAQRYARRWFSDPEVIIRVAKVRPNAKCAFRVLSFPEEFRSGFTEEVAPS